MFTRSIWFKFFTDLNSFIILLRFWKESVYLSENIFFGVWPFWENGCQSGNFCEGGGKKSSYFTREPRTCAKRERQAAGAVKRIKTRPGDAARSPSCNRPERQQLERNYEPRPRRLTHIQRSHMIFSRISLSLCRRHDSTNSRKSISLWAFIRASLWFLTTCWNSEVLRRLQAWGTVGALVRSVDSFGNFDNGPALKAVWFYECALAVNVNGRLKPIIKCVSKVLFIYKEPKMLSVFLTN